MKYRKLGNTGLIVSEVHEDYQTPNDLRMDVLLFDTWRELHDPSSGGKSTR